MEEQPIYIAYSEDLRRALAKADQDITDMVRDELAKHAIEATVDLAPDPTQSDGEDRDVFLLILAGAVAVPSVAAAVARVIDAITKRKAALTETKTLEVALDAKGNPVRDASGNPVYNVTTKPASFPPSGREKISFATGKLLKFDFERS